ncbi:rRNA metabolism protein, SBDS family [Candidatus Methanoperedens nitroreducens]|uniref:rRNA metabolism protein, SBDS family n=1 Tax=Candidatus Methanoperedens nitratireducens TaxID=1392998 RepID=A0A062UUL2_9EURY|nr:ribosome assembly factor SBDS [Candidatus Methanoperedens nitroreducens]KCZ70726.1 rRNA metabolism protein, SBDS family [Candidatus Methanoperedens nitroreducens]MDJ1420581.1 ribosome assembly factor SBDS [Candidatus Methanoperedens sp.]
MVTLDESIIARLKTHGKTFEVFVDPDGALALRRGDPVKVENILAVEDVFSDAKSGDRPAEQDTINAFGTTDAIKIAEKIIREGDLQLTTEQKKKIQEDKKKQVITVIAQNAINPQTKAPHPPARIEAAMNEAGIHIDPMKSVDELVNITMKAIRPIIPIRFEEVKIAIKLPPEYSAKAYGSVAKFGNLIKQEWQNDGSWIGVISIPAGMQDELYSLLNQLTKGSAETKFLK